MYLEDPVPDVNHKQQERSDGFVKGDAVTKDREEIVEMTKAFRGSWMGNSMVVIPVKVM